MPPAPPLAKAVPRKLALHGDTRKDEYFWLRDKGSPEVLGYLEAENRYTEAVMKPAEGLQATLYREMLSRIKETDSSAPARRGPWFYYSRTEKGKQYAIHCRRRAIPDSAEEILLDGNELAAGRDYFRLGALEPSPDHGLLAYSVDVKGDEVYTIHFRNLHTGEMLSDVLEGASAPLAWANDNRTCYYVTLDPAKRPYRAHRHRLGRPAGELLWQEDDERFEVEVSRCKSGAYIFLDISSQVTTEYRYLSADDPDGVLRALLPRRQDVEYEVAHHGDSFYIRINDRGRNFRLLRTPAGAPTIEDTVETRPHRPDVLLEHVDAFRDYLLLVEREDGLRQIGIENLRTGERHRVDFPEPVYAAWPMDNFEFDTHLLRFTYTSLVTPHSVFDYDMNLRTRELKKQTEVPGYDPARYASERVFATAPDGVRVPISLVYRREFTRDGRAPALLYGYGAYGINSEPSFSSDRVTLLDRGFVYAIAHIRGGEEMGRSWYESGRLLNKKNTFSDFIACAEHLVAENFTSSDRLAIFGGSAGGLLIGAVVNERPELFHTAIAKVPFVDVLNTMLDPSLPLTVTEYEEWGNPEDPVYYGYIRSYSPYENVKAQRYPNLLVTAGLNDPRVAYWEPAKWVARLRAKKLGDNLLLLKTNLGAGHFGASGRYDRLRETAFDYAFLVTSMAGAKSDERLSMERPVPLAS